MDELQGYILVYFFACFSVGIACLSVNLVSAMRKGDPLARAFLALYVSMSLVVFGALLRAFVEVSHPVAPPTRFAIEYLEAIVGLYGVMFTLPYFAHRVFSVENPRRDIWLGFTVAGALLIQHVTEFWPGGGIWDDRGDLFEDLLFAAIVLYVLFVGFTRLGRPQVDRRLALWFLGLHVIGLPGLYHDLFLGDDTGLRFYPLWYCAGSIIMTWYLARQRSGARPSGIPLHWGLSHREAEVARLVQRGQSNRAIAENLNISPNTVKSHLRAVFDKSGARSRFELMAATREDAAPEPDSDR